MNIVFAQSSPAALTLRGTAPGAPNITLSPAPGADIQIIATASDGPQLAITPPPDVNIVLVAPAESLLTLVVASSMPELAMTVAVPGTIVWGGGSGGSSDYANPAYPALTTIDKALNYLLYVAPQIESFSNNVGTVELGVTVHAVNLTWALNKTMTTLTLNGVSLPLTQTSDSLTGLSLTGNTTWLLSAGDGQNTAWASSTVAFLPRRWWGSSSLTSLGSSDILALGSSEFSSSRNQSRSMSASAAYLYFAWPSSFGTPSFTVNGLPSTAWIKTTVSATNASGYTQNYDVYRSQYLQNGSGIAVVVS